MADILENATFGDRFITRGGRMAVFIRSYSFGKFRNKIIIENDCDKEAPIYECSNDGHIGFYPHDEDIVAKYVEEE